MPAQIVMHKPRDPREQDVLPNDAGPFTVFDGIHASAPYEPVTDASKLRAIAAQKRERDLAIRATYDEAELDLLHENLIDSSDAIRLAQFFDKAYPGATIAERAEAVAVALRVFDPLWMLVSRYHAAEAMCGPLRLLLTKHFGVQGVPEDELRQFVDRLAGIAKQEIVNTFTAKRTTTARTWAAARLGFLIFGESAE